MRTLEYISVCQSSTAGMWLCLPCLSAALGPCKYSFVPPLSYAKILANLFANMYLDFYINVSQNKTNTFVLLLKLN